ncbi:preprotein translocase subunit SecA [Candidatus Xianfuyuplasma coldseepsis]|uniref:Protein translocase subunit SecA n=1 Tax=Candidatus Xianfuyuplasma coldseepsis TaxID=2782163 RepID=A0A7L7KP39_9MOLU|nr:preprotein translocase subunit SecA [Xianfuyuplasma coldseepsis]QMS84305.1 preprotein translocase subunit SecA [Xianfuyuplasma coldseepsis]
MIKRLFDPSRKDLKRYEKIAHQVFALEEDYKKLTDEQLQAKTSEFKERYQNGASLDSMLVEAFATVREASTRVLHMTPFFVQVMGACAIHEGNIAEMKTGEGKTLTSVMPAYLNAIPGLGVHIVTVNEYLASREAEGEIGELFEWLGLSVGLNIRDLTKEEKREAYNKDILYSTNNELGFDYLRDHMVIYKEQMVQRPLNYAIIDEIDSILIDEARTPLIISGGAKNTSSLYLQAQAFARNLSEEDYDIEIKTKNITLTENGISRAENYFSLDNLYDVNNVSILHSITNAIKANYTMDRDVDYVVQDNKVIIVDSFTGRLMHGRQFSEGLHQALEAKEGVEIKKETTTLATITFQNYFRMYTKLSGMTGTAKTEEEEFRNIYNMLVIEIPTNKPIVRDDANDLIFATMKAKYKAIAEEIKRRHTLGQPILVGTISIETSEYLSKLLKRRGIRHDVLNAKQHEREADIVENAGQQGSVTIATNMAGRGTDIKLGEGVVELGGLAVIGTERHESRRIDNQLRGRSGRQGDPGYTRFYLSAEDDLLRRFGGDTFKARLSMLTQTRGSDDESPIEMKFFSRIVERAQRQIEGNNFDRRKTVLQYDEVNRKQREVIYQQRRDILFHDDVNDIATGMIERTMTNLVYQYLQEESKTPLVNGDELYKVLLGRYFAPNVVSKSRLNDSPERVQEYVLELVNHEFTSRQEQMESAKFNEFLKAVILRVVDTYWVQHIDQMSELRQGIGLQSYAQMNPLREYQDTGFRMFNEMIESIERDVSRYVLRAQIRDNIQRVQIAKPTHTSSGKEETKRKPRTVSKVGRNDPCPCGSGKKYKHCHGK